MADDMYHRFRLTVPKDDVSIIKWVEQQSNLSVSLRMLIGDTIERIGFKDYTCRERVPAGVVSVRKGRASIPVQVFESESVEDALVEEPIHQSVADHVVATHPETPAQAEPLVRHAPVTQQPAVAPAKPVPHVPTGVPAGHVPDDDEIMRMFG